VNRNETPIQSQRKRHQRKPTRLSNGITQQINSSVKNEPSDTDDNRSMVRKKSELSLPTNSNSSNNNHNWLHQAFRSLVPSQSQLTDVNLTVQQNSTSPQSSKNKTSFSSS
jgi:hypothetical protein